MFLHYKIERRGFQFHLKTLITVIAIIATSVISKEIGRMEICHDLILNSYFKVSFELQKILRLDLSLQASSIGG
jgi:hypothetical protein